MIKINPLIFFLFLSSQVYSQQIYISKTHTESGEPVDLITNKTITESQTVSIIFDNGKRPIQKFVFLFIDKINSGGKINLYSKMLYADDDKNWTSEDYTFTHEGSYEIYFTDFKRSKLASTALTVKKMNRKRIRTNPNMNFCPA